MLKFDRRELRTAFGSFITGVTVVTAADEAGHPVGFTANSYTSVSLEPPMLLVCPARTLSSFEVFWSCTHFAVSVLAEDQQQVSNAFATASMSNVERFGSFAWHPDHQGSPLLDGAAAAFSCRSHSRMEAGDHLILIGEIDALECSGGAGLGFSNGGYFSLGLEREAQGLAPEIGDAIAGGHRTEID